MQITLMVNVLWFDHKPTHWQGPYLGKSFQGTPKEFIAGNLGKEWNGKDLNCNPTKDSSVLTLLSSTAMELRELPDNFNTVLLAGQSDS